MAAIRQRKINVNHYINALLPKLVEDCHGLLKNNGDFQKTARRAVHVAKVTQHRLGEYEHCSDFNDKNTWPPPSSPDLYSLDYHVCRTFPRNSTS